MAAVFLMITYQYSQKQGYIVKGGGGGGYNYMCLKNWQPKFQGGGGRHSKARIPPQPSTSLPFIGNSLLVFDDEFVKPIQGW